MTAPNEKDDFYHYLPVDEFTMQWGAYITSVGRSTIPPGHVYPLVGHPSVYDFDWKRGRILPEFSLMLFSEGAGTFETEATGVVEFEEPVLAFLFPGVWHTYRPDPARGWKERWISFNGTTSHRLTGLNLIDPGKAIVPIKEVGNFTERFDGLLQRVHQDPSQNSVILSLHGMSIITEALAYMVSEPQQQEEGSDPHHHIEDDVARQTIELIWTHSHRPASVGQIAKQIKVNRRTLERRFAAAVGHSILEEINNCRLSRAKRLLAETDLPVKTVAYLAGFSNYERLRVAIVAAKGVSPSQFREESQARKSE